MRREYLKVVVRYADGAGEGQDACFYYVTVWNRGERIAQNVVPHVTVNFPRWKDAGVMPLFIIPRPAYPLYLIRSTNLAPDKEASHRFADALSTRDLRTDSMSLDGRGLTKNFVLFFTLKGSNVLYIPTAGPRFAWTEYPCNFRIVLYLQGKGMPYRRARSYQINGKSWSDITPTEMD